MLTCSETFRTFSMPLEVPVLDFAPKSPQVSMPGKSALNPTFAIRLICSSERSERVLSATKSI